MSWKEEKSLNSFFYKKRQNMKEELIKTEISVAL